MGKATDIKDKIYALLQTLDGSGQPFSAVYDHMPAAEDREYPFAGLEILGGTGGEKREDTFNNLCTYVFRVYLGFKKEAGSDPLELRLDTLDAVLDKLRTDQYIDTLDGVIHILDISWAAGDFSETVPCHGFVITFTCKVLQAKTFGS